MATQSILLTALPNGIADTGDLRVSILVSPRLDAQAAPQLLSTFKDFVDWPTTLMASTLSLTLGSNHLSIDLGKGSNNVILDTSKGAPDSALWQAMLPANTHVSGFSFADMSQRKILSYDTAKFAERQQQLYAELARNADDGLPMIKTLRDSGAWHNFMSDVQQVDRSYMESKEGLARDVSAQFADFMAGKLATNQPSAQRDLAYFQLFHTPVVPPKTQSYAGLPVEQAKLKAKWQSYEATALPNEAQLASQYDFHQVVAAMNQYPLMLRQMGLVVDLLLNPRGLKFTQDDLLSASIKLPKRARAGERQVSATPKVHCRVQDRQFYTLSDPQQSIKIEGGLIDINNDHFALLQHDVDGTGIKAMNAARTLARQSTDKVRLDPTTRHERHSGVPSLRNAGLMLVHRHRAEALQGRFVQNKTIQQKIINAQQGPTNQLQSASPELYAQDAQRGLRVDIWDNHSKQWHSLCRRNAQFQIKGYGLINSVDEEGVVRLAATQSANRNYLPDLLVLHEMILSWTGWSLCAPAPGKVVDENDTVADQLTDVPNGMPLSSVFTPTAGSLPRLRFGRSYWVRARVVDLAGNSLPFQSSDMAQEKPQQFAQPYWRFEPIKPPVLALYKPNGTQTEAPQEGESMYRMAVRTFNATPDLNTIDTLAQTHRFALCDSSSVKDAEYHGMLDSAGKVDPSFFALLASKDAPLAQEKIPSIPLPVPLENGNPPGETDYAVLTEGSVHPYLPDPLCIEFAARLFGHPDIADNVVIPIRVYPPNGSWPHALPFKITLYEKTGELPHFSEQERTLYVPLPKAFRVTLRLSVKPEPRALTLMGVWNWLSAQERKKLRSRALNGQHWMLTPWREIELVHAVQKPLITPEPKLQVIRFPGHTWAIPRYTAPVSLRSTEVVDLLAHWHEPTLEASQSNLEKRALAFRVKIHHAQRYAGKPEHQTLKPDLIRAGSKDHPALVDKVQEFGDTRYRRVEYWLEATSPFREYMPAAVLTELVNGKPAYSDEQIKVVGPKVVDWIPNTAPPAAPEVLYVVPTYQWFRSRAGGKAQSSRRGGGLRVYLDGPWYDSGYGEMLAVVLPCDAMANLDPNDQPSSQPVKNFVTQWGNDAVWTTPFISGPAPKISDFPLRRTQADATGSWLPSFAPASEADQPSGNFVIKNLPHPQIKDVGGAKGKAENPLKRINIAPHDVQYDEERGLWYCDIELNPNSTYYPFVRLALARYQPVSLENCHLSNVVLSDFMTLANDRHLSLSHTAKGQQYSLHLMGNSYSNNSGFEESPNLSQPLPGGQTKLPDIRSSTVVKVWVEKLNPALGEDLGWQPDDSAQVSENSRSIGPVKRVASKITATDRKLAKQLLKQRDFQALQSQDLLQSAFAAPALWKGTVQLTHKDSMKRRLVIAEYEQYLVDETNPYDGFASKRGERLVFVEHINLHE